MFSLSGGAFGGATQFSATPTTSAFGAFTGQTASPPYHSRSATSHTFPSFLGFLSSNLFSPLCLSPADVSLPVDDAKAEEEKAEAFWYREERQSAEAATDEMIDQLLDDAVHVQAGGDVRLRLFGDPTCTVQGMTENSLSIRKAMKRRLKDLNSPAEHHPALSAVYLPHGLISSFSALHSAFVRGPPDALQLRNVRLTRVTNEGSKGPALTSDSQQRLTDLFAELSRDSRAIANSPSPSPKLRLHIQGELCGNTAIVGRLASDISDLELSFEATVHPCEFDLSSYILPLSREARSHAGQQEELTERRMWWEWTKAEDLARPRVALGEFYRVMGIRQLKIDNPDYDQWDYMYREKRIERISSQFLKFSPDEIAAVQRQFDEVQRVCDEEDEAIRQRWMQKARAASPGVDPVWLHVIDSSIEVSAKYTVPGQAGVKLPLLGGVRFLQEVWMFEMSLDSKQSIDAKSLAWSMKELKARSIHMRERLGYEPDSPLNPHLLLPSLLSDTLHVSQLKVKWRVQDESEWTLQLSYAFDRTRLELMPGVTLLHATQHIRSTVTNFHRPPNCESKMELELIATWKPLEGEAHPAQSPADSSSTSGELPIPFSMRVGHFNGLMNWKVTVAQSVAPELFDVFNRAFRLLGKGTTHTGNNNNFPSIRSLVRRCWPSARFVESVTAGFILETAIRLEASATRATYLRLPLFDQGLIGWMEAGRMQEAVSVFVAPKAGLPNVLRVEWRQPNSDEKSKLLDDAAGSRQTPPDADSPNKKAKTRADNDVGGGTTSAGVALPVELSLRSILISNNLAELLPLCPSAFLDRVRCTTISTLVGNLDSSVLTVHLRASSDELGPANQSVVVLREPGYTLLKLQDHLLYGDTTLLPGVFGLALPPLAQLKLSFVILLAPTPLVADRALNSKLQGSWYVLPHVDAKFPTVDSTEGKGQSKGKGKSSILIPVGAHFLLQDLRRDRRSDWYQWMTVEEASRVPAPLPPAPSISAEAMERSRASLPVVLLSDPRSTIALVHYLCEWLDINELLFGLRRINRALHSSPTLTDGAWWKRRLQVEHNPRVCRWSEEVLQHWRRQLRWPVRPFGSFGVVDTGVQSAEVTALPIWFDVAVHIQVRLNAFATDILRQTIPQLTDKGTKDDEDRVEQKVDVAKQSFGDTISIPSALLTLLLNSPPFHPANLWILHPLGGYQMGVFANREALRSAAYDHTDSDFNCRHPHLLWFAYKDQEESTWFAALYTGIHPLRRVLIQEGTPQQGGKTGSAPAGNVVTEAVGAEVEGDPEFISRPCTDLNECPVIRWEVYQQSLVVAALNVHDFLSSLNAFTTMRKDTVQYEKDAAKIASTLGVQPMKEEQRKDSEKKVEKPSPAPLYELDLEYMNGVLMERIYTEMVSGRGRSE